MLCDDRDGRNLSQVDLDAPIEFQLIEEGISRNLSRISVLEFEVAEPGLDRLGAEPTETVG